MTADLEFVANVLGVTAFAWNVAKPVCAKLPGAYQTLTGENQFLVWVAGGAVGILICCAAMGMLLIDLAGGPEWFSRLLEVTWLSLPRP